METTALSITDAIAPIMVQLFANIPVVLTILVVQSIKWQDKKDKLKKHYWTISLAVGVVIGVVFTADHSNLWGMAQDGFKNAAIAGFLTGLKNPLGIRLPGDARK